MAGLATTVFQIFPEISVDLNVWYASTYVGILKKLDRPLRRLGQIGTGPGAGSKTTSNRIDITDGKLGIRFTIQQL
jgi:hypothetical protein